MQTNTPTHDTTLPKELRFDGPAAEILNVLHTGVLLVDDHQQIRYRNATAASWLPEGHDLESVFADARFFEEIDWHEVLDRVLRAGELVRADCALRLSSSSGMVLASVRCAPLRACEVERVCGAVIVIEERQADEMAGEQIEVSKRLASLGKLASRVAHELNNPLDGILRYVNLALRVVEDMPDPKLKSYLSESRAGLMRMVQIIAELLEFSRVSDGAFEAVNINEIVEQAVKVTASNADASGVVVSADFQMQDMPLTSGSRLYQVCCNLIKNAIDVMPDGGRLSITTGLAGEDVVIRVADTGSGLPDPPEKVFEAFFTTKEPGKGTGLGLAICRDFIEDMKGTISATPGDNGGAVFTVRVPRSSFKVYGHLTTAGAGRPGSAPIN